MEHGGHHEEPTEAEAVDPGGNGLPVIVRQKVEVGAAEDAGNDPKLGARRGPVMQDQPPAGVPGGEAPAPPSTPPSLSPGPRGAAELGHGGKARTRAVRFRSFWAPAATEHLTS